MRRLVAGLVPLLVVVVVTFVLVRGRGARVQITPAEEAPTAVEEEPTTYVTEHGQEIASPQVRYDAPKAGTVSSLSPVSNVYFTPAGEDMLGIITRDIEVEVLGESTNEAGELYYLVKGFGTEGWVVAADITLEEP